MVSDGEGDVDEHLPVQALPNRPHHRKGSGVPELRGAKKSQGTCRWKSGPKVDADTTAP
jgi:hypothetical protein